MAVLGKEMFLGYIRMSPEMFSVGEEGGMSFHVNGPKTGKSRHIYLSIYLCLCVSLCLSVSLSVCLSVCLSV